MKFLEECEEKEERCFVNDNLISFSAILDQVSTRQFFATLPSSIRKVINKDTSSDDKLSSGPRIKKQKVDKSMDPKKESNEGKIEDWILDIETFNKKVVGMVPVLLGMIKEHLRVVWCHGEEHVYKLLKTIKNY